MRARNISLDTTLSCGQAFRWHKHGDKWHGVVSGKAIEVEQEGNGLKHRGCSQRFLERYLALDTDYSGLRRKARANKPLLRAMDKYPGLRILRQDPWEALVSYLCSSNNSIPSIQRCVENIAMEYGPKADGAFSAYAFPKPEEMSRATEKKLRALKLGFRAPFVHDLIGLVNDAGWDVYGLGRLGYENAKKELMTLHGVGEKVADCVCLFAYGFGEAVPVDVWARRACQKALRCKSDDDIRVAMQKKFGAHAGWAQEYLYHYERNK